MATLSKQARALRKEIKRVLPLLRELECHECPDEPKPAKVECDRDHRSLPMYYPHWSYCPSCGVALTKEG